MIPFGSNDVTLYHVTDSGITKLYISGASWTMHTSRTLYDGVQKMANSSSCVCRWARGTAKAAVGDLLILGRVQESVTSCTQFAGMIEKYAGRSFICEAFSDNGVGSAPMKHYCARGAAYGA